MGSEYDLTGSEGLLDENNLTEARVRVGLSNPVSPEKQAAIVDMARRANLPVDVVSRNYDAVVKRQESAELPFDKIQQQTPNLATWLASAPENGGLVKDDLHKMGNLEWMLSAPQVAYKRGEAQQEAGRLRFQSMFGNLSIEDQKRLADSVSAMNGPSMGEETWFGKALTGGATQVPQLLTQFSRGLQTGTKLGAVGALIGAVGGPAAPITALGGFTSGMGVGLVSEAAIYSFEQEAGHAYSEYLDVKDENGNTIDPAAAKAAALAVGAVNAGLEVVGVGVLLKSIPGAHKVAGAFARKTVKEILTVPTVRKALTSMVMSYGGVITKETAVEVAQRAVTILGDEIARQSSGVEGRPAGQIASDLGNEAVGAAQAFTYIAGPGPVMEGALETVDVLKARERQQFFEALGSATAETKLSQRLPAKLQEFIASATKDGPIENVYIPASDWQTLFHAQEQDAGELVQKLTGDRSGYDEAISTGGDFSMPMSVYASRIAPTEMNAELAKVIRLRPGEMNAVEAEEYLANAKADEQFNTEQDPADVVRQDVIGQLLASGYDRATAEAQAEVQAQFYATQAAKLGISPAELYQQYPMNVVLDIPEVLAKVGTTDEIDNLIDRYRAGQIPDERKAMGEPLSDFIARQGGMVDEGGELQSRDLNKVKAGPHHSRLMREGGKTIEQMTELAWSAGFIQDYDQAQFFDALDADLGGNRVYSMGNNNSEATAGLVDRGDHVARAQLDQFNALHDWVTQQGIDVNTMSNADIKARLMRPEGQTLQQLPETIDVDGVARPTLNSNGLPIATTEEGIRNFWRWFGESKVVDEEGRPLVVYHGTDADFSTFDKGKVKSRFPYSFGLHFTDRPPEASRYAEDPGGSIMPAYVRATNPLTIQTKEPSASMEADLNRAEIIRQLVEARDAGHAYDSVIIERKRGDEWDGINVIVFAPDQIKSAVGNNGAFSPDSPNILYQPADGSMPRGSITFPEDRSRFDIRLMKDANLSTFMHESGHQFFEVIGSLVEAGRATPEMQKDYQSLLNWLGVKSRAEITVEHQEQFARGFEAYLREGKAPSAELRSMFAKFRAWLVGIYRQAKSLNVELTDEVRGVMDRMLATEDQIAAAESEAGVMAAFATAEDAGMSDIEFAAYQSTVEKASEKAKDTLQAKLMAQLAREQKKWWKDETDRIRTEVTDHVNTLREYFALSVLQKGEMPDGSALPEGMKHIRLNKDDLEATYGKVTRPKGKPKQQMPDSGMLAQVVKGQPTTAEVTFTPNTVMNKLAALKVWGKGGINPEFAAEYLGYASGNDLVMALVNIRPKKELIEAETQRRMLELYPDIRFDGSLAGEAAAAVQNEGREKVLRMELSALRKKAREVRPFVRAAEKEGKIALDAEKQARAQQQRDQKQAQRAGLQAIRSGTPSADLLKEVARRTIAGKRIRDINPAQYLATAHWQAKKAIEAAAMGATPIPSKKGMPGYPSGYAWAADLKQREILNHYLYREALKARDAVDGALGYIAKAESKKSRDRMALAGYLDQWDALLERFSFKRTSPRKADQKAALAAWADAQEEAGLPVNIPDYILDESRRESYVNLTFEELAGLMDSLKQIRRFSTLVTKLNASKDKREWAQAKAALLDSVMKSSEGGKGHPVSPFEEGVMKTGWRAIGEFADGINRPETIIEWLDSGDSGPWHDYFWDSANEAEYSRETLRKKIVEPLYELASNITIARRRELERSVTIPGLGPLNRRTLISMAVNMGNAGNLERLMKGGIREGAGIRQLTERNIEDIKAALTAEDWHMVQTIWDTIDQLWPMIRDLEERLTGQAPDRVEAVPVVTPHGTFRGGYFPVVYDPYASKAGRKQAEAGTATDKMFSNFTQAVTGKSHTKGRVAVGGPLLLDYGRVVTRHVDQVITDLTHREFVIDALKILNDREISLAIQDKQGAMALSSLNGMLRHAVHSDYGFTDAMDRSTGAFFSRMVSNVAVMALGFKVVTAWGNAVLAPIQAMSRIEKTWIARGFGQFYAHPKDMTQFIYARSAMMKTRMDNLDDSFVTVVHKLRGKPGVRAQVARAAMSVHWGADWLTSHALWIGRYQQALHAGETEARAAKLADKAIRTTQTAGAPKDLSALERSRNLRQYGLTMFMGPLVIMSNRISEATHMKGVVKSWPEALGVLMASWFLPAIVWELVTGKGPGEDDDPALWALRKLFVYRFMGYPIAREAASVIDARGEGYRVNARAFPAADALISIIDAGEAAYKAGVEMVEGGDPDTEKLSKKMMKALGAGVGLPTGQAAITATFMHDLYTGEYAPETPLDWRYLVMKRPKE